MPRSVLFEKEPVSGLGGLAGLTCPDASDASVSVIVDAVVLGAKSDGKTQLITHAIRTLDAHSPTGLSPEEKQLNEKMVGLVLNAKRPQPEANPDRKVRHYTVRVKPSNLLGGLAAGGQLGLLATAGLLGRNALAALVSAGAAFGALVGVRGGLDAPALIGTGTSLALGLLWAAHAARRRLLEGGEAEIVFWDVAGEDVYSDRGAGAYHAFLAALIEARQARRQLLADEGRDVRHAFAPILVCNPLAVGRFGEDSSYARLRMIMPTFAALVEPTPDILVVVNRWELVRAVCGDGEHEADSHVAVLPVARDAPVVAATPGALADPLPVVKRGVVQRHCVDGEPAAVGKTRFRTIHYDAGLDTEVKLTPWSGFPALPDDARARWREPSGDVPVEQLIEYRYAEGPGSLTGAAALGFYGWLGGLMWQDRQRTPALSPSVPGLPVAGLPAAGLPATAEPVSNHTVKMFGPLVPQAAGERPGPETSARIEEPEGAGGTGEGRGGFRSGT